MSVPACDVCGRSLSPRGRRVTGCCGRCRMAGAAFARAWMADLRARGLQRREIAAIVGTTANTVGARLHERDRGWGTR